MPLLPPPPPTTAAPAPRRPRRTTLAAGVALATALAAAGAVAPASAASAAETPISQGKRATASSTENPDHLPASAAVDGDRSTRWASQRDSDTEYLQVDLGSVSRIDRVDLGWEYAYGEDFTIQVSNDEKTFTPVATVTGGAGGDQSLDVSASGRYVRMAATKRGTGYGYSLEELQVFGALGAGGSTPTPPTPPPPTTPPTDPGTRCADGPADGKVRVTGAKPSWCLLVDGEPWTVKGMTWGPAADQLDAYAPQLRDLGVNTLRTWGTDASSKAFFDSAASHGIRVVAGFWLGPGGGPGSGGCPNYVTDTAYKDAVMGDIKTWTTAYRDNPGVLMWDVGNESLLGLGGCYGGAELEAQRDAYATFVNDAAKVIHSIDPNHPVTTTDAWTGAWPYLKANAPDLDLYGLNSYGALCDAKQTWVDGGYDKPYLVTEAGPAGEWEAPDDVNGIPDQGDDADNAAGYTRAWECVQDHAGVALGATMFHFGDEGDFGGIWFNVLPGNNRRLSYYAIARAYGGPAGAAGTNTPPVFASMTVPTSVVAGSTLTVDAPVSDPQGDAITYDVLLNSKHINGAGGLARTAFTRSGSSFSLTAPDVVGVWKVYVFAEDGHGNVGVQTRSVRVVPPTPAGTNIAAGRPAKASSFDPYNGNYTPGQATDGDLTTRWSSEWSDDQHVQVDLGSVRSFDSVQLVWESAFAKRYRIEVSDDGDTWNPIATVDDGDGNADTIATGGRGRYVRVQGVQRGTGFGYSLYELGVYA